MWTVLPFHSGSAAGGGVTGPAARRGGGRGGGGAGDGRRRFGLRCGRGRCGGSRLRHIGDTLALGGKNADRRVHRHAFGALFHQDLCDGAFVDRFDLHGRLVGLDFADHLARLHHVAHLHVPFGKLALRHGRRQGGHQNRNGHQIRPRPGRRSTIPMGRARDCAAHIPPRRSRSCGSRHRRLERGFVGLLLVEQDLRTWSIGSRSLRYLSTLPWSGTAGSSSNGRGSIGLHLEDTGPLPPRAYSTAFSPLPPPARPCRRRARRGC